jgi:hypothetical protein
VVAEPRAPLSPPGPLRPLLSTAVAVSLLPYLFYHPPEAGLAGETRSNLSAAHCLNRFPDRFDPKTDFVRRNTERRHKNYDILDGARQHTTFPRS